MVQKDVPFQCRRRKRKRSGFPVLARQKGFGEIETRDPSSGRDRRPDSNGGETLTKPLRPFFSYFGAKWRLAPKYPAPRFDRVVELYAGSACYSLHHHTRDVVLCEAYAPVAALWRYLIDCAQRGAEREILALPDLGDRSVDDFGLAPGPAALIGFWCNAGVARPCKRMSKNARNATHQLYWGPRVRERVAEQLPAIKHWAILEGRFQDVCEYRPDATYFIDPPYQVAGHAYGVSNVNYSELADMARDAHEDGAQVIVCEAEGADWLPFRPFAVTKAMPQGNGERKSREVIWP